MDTSDRRLDGSAPSTPRGDVLAAVHRALEMDSSPTSSKGLVKSTTDTPGTGDSNRRLRSSKKEPRDGDREPGRVLAMLEKRLDSERPRILLDPRGRDRSFSSIATE